MLWTGRLQMRSMDSVRRFLAEERVGRLATIDARGYPQIIPMNFAFWEGAVYMHSHIRGEKLDNMARDARSGFEADRELAFLPSYFSSPTDASMADTLYASVVIKGTSSLVEDGAEKAGALNALMRKYQPEGGYEPLRPGMGVLDHVAVIRTRPEQIRGKYKIGQHMGRADRRELAAKILERGAPGTERALKTMGFEPAPGGLRMVEEPEW